MYLRIHMYNAHTLNMMTRPAIILRTITITITSLSGPYRRKSTFSFCPWLRQWDTNCVKKVVYPITTWSSFTNQQALTRQRCYLSRRCENQVKVSCWLFLSALHIHKAHFSPAGWFCPDITTPKCGAIWLEKPHRQAFSWRRRRKKMGSK